MIRLILFCFLFSVSINAYAYIGPGMGGGVIAAIFGFLAAILIAFWSILYYPIKRAIKNRQNKKTEN